MTLVTTTTSLPDVRPGMHYWGRTGRDELISLGANPRLSLGERLLKKYKKFHQVVMGEQETEFDCEARSATGEMYFSVKLTVEYRVNQGRAAELINMDDDAVKRYIQVPITRDAEEISEGFAADDDRAFQEKLKHVLDPRRGGQTQAGPFELIRVNLRAHVPNGVRAREEIALQLRDLDARIPLAEVEGNTAEAARLRRARDALREAMKVKGDDTISNAERVKRMQGIIESLINSGTRPNHETIKSLEAEQQALIKNVPNSPSLGAETPERPNQLTDGESDDLN